LPLFDPEHDPELAPEDAIVAVRRFLGRCRSWATDREIPKRIERVRLRGDPAEAAKLHAWVSMVAFIDHAIAEVEAGDLDPWFEPPVPDAIDG
jgi:hypothetical protein